MKFIEGVPYHRHVVRYTTIDGKRRRMVHWSPGHPWVRTEVLHTLDARVGVENIKPRSVTIVLAALALFSSLACSGPPDDSAPDVGAPPQATDAADARASAPDASPCGPGCRCAPGYSAVRTSSACGCRAADGRIACTAGVF